MLWRALADTLVVAHLAFVGFVVGGGFLTWRWPRLVWVHLPALLWGAGIELASGICPLTPLENLLRRRGGEAGYAGGFVEHYLLPTLYPDGLTPRIQTVLGVGVLLLNTLAYAVVLRRRWRQRGARPGAPGAGR